MLIGLVSITYLILHIGLKIRFKECLIIKSIFKMLLRYNVRLYSHIDQ